MAVSSPTPVGYCAWTSAGPRALSREVPSTSPSISFSSGAKPATKTSPTTLAVEVAALVMTAPP